MRTAVCRIVHPTCGLLPWVDVTNVFSSELQPFGTDISNIVKAFELSVSAETGCSLCNLFWTQLKNSCTKRAIDMHLVDRKCPNGDRTNTKIYLTGDLQDPGSGFLNQSFNQGSLVWVSAGEIDEQSSDPNVRITTCLQVFTEPGEKSLYFCLLKGFRLL